MARFVSPDDPSLKPMKHVICLGCVVLDRVFLVKSLPNGAGKLKASGFLERGGGMAATAAVAVAALGGRAVFWGRVGDDPAGRILLEQLARAGVDASQTIVVPEAQTATSAVHIDAGGERQLTNFAGARLPEQPVWLPLGWVKDADCVLADVRWASGAEVLFGEARRHGIPRILDADAADPDAIRILLPYSDHAIFSAAGLQSITGTSDPEAGLRRLPAPSDGVLAVTLGPAGSLWLAGDGLFHIPAFAGNARNTNGVGDVFHGAYALAIAQGQDIVAAARFATAAAGLKSRSVGGWDAMPTRQECNVLLGTANEAPNNQTAGSF